jgi:hypothetical protein
VQLLAHLALSLFQFGDLRPANRSSIWSITSAASLVSISASDGLSSRGFLSMMHSVPRLKPSRGNGRRVETQTKISSHEGIGQRAHRGWRRE